MMMNLIILLLTILVVSLYSIFKFLYKVWLNPIRIQNLLDSQGIKGPQYKFLHGNTKQIFIMRSEARKEHMELTHDVFRRIQPHTHAWINTYGKIYLSWHGTKAQLNIAEPELVKEILNDKDGAYPKRKNEGYAKKLFGDALVTTSGGKKWARNRKLANHAFHGECLKGMIPSMITATEIMLERWKKYEGKEIEVVEEFRLLACEVISRTAFGSSYVEGVNIFNMLMQMVSIFSSNLLVIRFPGIGKIWPTADDIKSSKLEREIEKSVLQMIKNREEKIKSGELLDGYGCDYLGLLVKTNQNIDENKRISIKDMIDECKTFYLAGHETTTCLLASMCLLLAAHTDWQDKARKEVIELFGEKNPTLDDNSIARLKTMTMIINETLRLYPPVLTIVRKVAREVRLGKLVLPAGIEVSIPTLALHHDSEIWGEDVNLFKPERFSEGVMKATNNNPMAFLPFGAGPRNCVGTSFAMNETKIALIMILQRYEFSISPTYVHSPVQYVLTHLEHGVQIILRPRH